MTGTRDWLEAFFNHTALMISLAKGSGTSSGSKWWGFKFTSACEPSAAYNEVAQAEIHTQPLSDRELS